MKTNFIDYVKIFCKSGNGGSGLVHFNRKKFTPKGGPDGGNGGRGGHIIIEGDKQLWTLLPLKYTKHVKSQNGKNGGPNCLTGAMGYDAIIRVPIGSIIKNENEEIIFEITKDKEKKILIKGGKGGMGNWHFRSSINQTPHYAQSGQLGVECHITIELKLLADVGLVGFPNSGKSTLLKILSNAKPKISNYPFTTIVPNLGIISCNNFQSFIMADIPGIIQGASIGKGLGYRFLRHIERNSVLLFIIPSDSSDHINEYNILLKELKNYNPNLLNKRSLVAISKSDFLDNELKKLIKNQFNNEKVIFFSSITQDGIHYLKYQLLKLLQ